MEISTWCGLNVSFRSSMLKLSYQGDDVRGCGRQLSYKDRILISGISSPMKGMGIQQALILLQPITAYHNTAFIFRLLPPAMRGHGTNIPPRKQRLVSTCVLLDLGWLILKCFLNNNTLFSISYYV